jgi:hypothetical protein
MPIPVNKGGSNLRAKVRIDKHPIPGTTDLRGEITKDDHIVQLTLKSTLRSTVGRTVVVFPRRGKPKVVRMFALFGWHTELSLWGFSA